MPAAGEGTLDLVRKCHDLVGQGRGLKWMALVVLALVVTGVEALGAALVFVLLALVTNPQAPPQLPVIGDLGPYLGEPIDERTIVAVAAAIAVFFVVRSVLIFAQTYLQHLVAQNAGAQLASRLLRGYLAMPYAVHLRRNSAELIRNSLHSVQTVISQVVMPLVRLVAEVLLVAGLLAVLFAVSPLATAAAAVVLGPVVGGLVRVVHPRVKRLGRRAQRSLVESLSTAQESLQGIRDVKLFGREVFFARAFARSRKDFARSLYLRAALADVPPLLIETFLVAFITLFLAVTLLAGGQAQGALSVLGLFAYVGLRLQPALRRIMTALNNMKFGHAAVDDVHTDLRQIAAAPPLPKRPDAGALPFSEALVADGVGYRYEGAPVPAVTGVDLAVRPGQAIGICGPTGGGKSTLVDLLVGLLEPTTGRVLVDGQDIHSALAAWQSRLGVVSQSVFLLDGSLRDNIAFGVPDGDVDAGRVAEAVRLAQLERVVAALPEGLDTRVGERGVRLSGGQRQRVAIARALYRDPAVLVFDEGTSALDTETEAELVADLEHLRGQHTIVLVAHRLGTVRRCDEILVVEAGAITDRGTFDELSRRHRLFSEFAPR